MTTDTPSNAFSGSGAANYREIPESTGSIDVRLVPVALALWMSEASFLLLVGQGRVGTWIMFWVVVATAFAAQWRLARHSRRFELRRYLTPLVLLTLCVSLLGGTALAALRLSPLMAEQVVVLGNAQAVAKVEVELNAPPRVSRTQRPTPNWGQSSASADLDWTAPATLLQVLEGERLLQVSVPILLMGSARDQRALDTLVPTSRLAMSGSFSPGDPSRGIAAMVRVRGSPKVVENPKIWQRAAAKIRDSMRAAASELNPDAKGLLPGLVVGDESGLSEELREQMQQTGLSHLTAVSGANLAIITGAVLFMAMAFRVPRRLAILIAALSLLGFVTVVGPQPSVLRAACMGAVALLALLAKRTRAGIAALAASVVIVLLIDPWMAVSMGFALSVAATAGLLIYAHVASTRIERARTAGIDLSKGRTPGKRLRRATLISLGVATSAQLATLPLVASFGEGLPVVGVVANMLCEPAVPFATVLGCLAAGIGLLSPEAGMAIASVAGIAAWWIAAVARFSSNAPGSVIPWPSGILGFTLAVLLVIALVFVWRRRSTLLRIARSRPRDVALAAASVLVVTFVWRATETPWPPPGWLVVACDVGQGDALVVVTGEHRGMVIDVGPDAKKVDRCLSDLGISVIDVLVLSHFHADHVDGLPGALRNRQVNAAIVSPLAEPAAQFQQVVERLDERGIPHRVAAPGEDMVVGAARVQTLWPSKVLAGSGSAPNNASVAMAVEVGSPVVTALFTGDLEPPAQQLLLGSVASTEFDLVKVPHHGSRNQDAQLATSFPASIAIVSVGTGNSYGHPAANTIEQWRTVGAEIARTDQSGDIAVGRDTSNHLFLRGRLP